MAISVAHFLDVAEGVQAGQFTVQIGFSGEVIQLSCPTAFISMFPHAWD